MSAIERAAEWACSADRRTMILGRLDDSKFFCRLCEAVKADVVGYGPSRHTAAYAALMQLTIGARSAQ